MRSKFLACAAVLAVTSTPALAGPLDPQKIAEGVTLDPIVDARLRVHGTGRLRVIDASAFPNITSGNTNAPTMMLAARAADLIREDDRR